MIFIRPTIMRDDGLLSEVSQRKYNYVRAQQLAQGDKVINLMPGAETPAMPEFDETLIIPPTFDEYLQKKQAQDKEAATPAQQPAEQGNN